MQDSACIWQHFGDSINVTSSAHISREINLGTSEEPRSQSSREVRANRSERYSASSVRPRSAADCLIRSTDDISQPRQQGNPRAGSSVTSDPVCGVISKFKIVKGASAKRGKKQPVSPGAAYRAASTNSESPYWRRGVVLPQEPLELFGMPLQIVRSAPSYGGHPDDLVEVPMLPPDHYRCGPGCARFTGTLAAVEEHERSHCHCYRLSGWLRCVRCLLITESPKTPHHYRYQI